MRSRRSSTLVLSVVLCLFALGLSGVKGHTESSQTETETSDINDADYYQLVPIVPGRSGSLSDALNSVMNAAPYGYRPGSATRTNSCQRVRSVPTQLRNRYYMKPHGLSTFYQKYTEAYGIPVVSSSAVSDDGLRRACYTLRFLMASHSGIRQSFYRLSGRVAVIGKNEGTTSIPEHSHLPSWWNQRARGLGATPSIPVSSGGEENVLCLSTDRYRQDIYLHESAHGVHLLGAAFAISGWDTSLRYLYRQAKARGLWANTYSMSTAEEYFAEGTQSYFNVNSYAARPDGVRGPINTRPKLRAYDPQLYNMIQQVFPCDNTYLKRCDSNRAQEHAQALLMDCNLGTGTRPTTTTGTGIVTGTGTATTTTTTTTTGTGTGSCSDSHQNCGSWARSGECNNNPSYMHVNCRRSCNTCTSNCADTGQYCSYWARTGQCSINPTYMNDSCRRSCNRC